MKDKQPPKRTDMEFKTFKFKLDGVKADNADEGSVEGYASVFNNIDLGLDVVDKGAFAKSIQENGGKVPILADHNPYTQIGWNEKALEDSRGLFVQGSLTLKVQKAAERYALAKKALEIGAPMGLSIGYTTIKAEPDSTNIRIRRLKELKLWEYSFVTFPMNTEAMVTAAKSMGAIDKVNFLISQLNELGVSKEDLELALRKEAAQKDFDPTQLCQSIDSLIEKFRS